VNSQPVMGCCCSITTPVVDRTGKSVTEVIPGGDSWRICLLYGNCLGRCVLQCCLREYLRSSSKQKGVINDDPASAKDIQRFVDDYGVDVSDAEKPLAEYKTLNEFFSRRLKPGSRIVYEEKDVQAVISPCDCRLNAWENVDLSRRVDIKGREFTLGLLIGGKEASDAGINLEDFNGGSFCVLRLAPTDYHRFHAPFDCTVRKRVETGTDLYSVKTYAINSRVNVLTDNHRVVLYLDSPIFGQVAYIAVGATHVGSINILVKEEQQLKTNDEIGFFQYGGSTVVIVFKAACGVKFDEDVVRNSSRGMETMIKLGNRLGARM